MKIKQFLYITDTVAFARGNKDCFSVSDYGKHNITGWMLCGEIEIDVDIDTGKVAAKAIADIETKQKEVQLAFTEKMAQLDQAKQELLCICNDGADNE